MKMKIVTLFYVSELLNNNNMYKQNILCLLLELLDVKHTKEHALHYYETHPHKNDLLGLSQMLTYYGIKNEGIKLERNKETIFEIKTPFIAHFNQSFAIIIVC